MRIVIQFGNEIVNLEVSGVTADWLRAFVSALRGSAFRVQAFEKRDVEILAEEKSDDGD